MNEDTVVHLFDYDGAKVGFDQKGVDIDHHACLLCRGIGVAKFHLTKRDRLTFHWSRSALSLPLPFIASRKTLPPFLFVANTSAGIEIVSYSLKDSLT